MNFKYDVKDFNAKEVAKMWNVKPKTIAYYYRQNLIPKAYKKSNTWKILSGSIKPLNPNEIKKTLFLITKIYNYLNVDSSYISNESESLLELIQY